MFIASQYSKSFYSHGLNHEKYELLLANAKKINEVKNELSKIVSKDLEYYLSKKKFDYINMFKSKYTDRLSSADLNGLISQVYNSYQSKFEAITKKLEFKKVKSIKVEYYKRATKYNKKGDEKSIKVEYEKSNLSIALSYLIRNGFSDTENHIRQKLKDESLDKKMKMVYTNVLSQIDKFGFARLCKLAMDKKNRIFKQYNTPINFQSLSFVSNNRIKDDIISYNRNYNSVINSFITLSNISGEKRLIIPVKHSKQYHNEMKKYEKGIDTAYTVCFTDKPNEVRIVLSYEDDRYIPDNKENYIGVDVNIKRNMYSTSEETTIDYNRELLNRYAEELLKLDELKENKEYTIGKKREKLLNSLKTKIDNDLIDKSVKLIKHVKELGFDHMVMEDLAGFNNKTYGDDPETKMKISRLSRALQLSSNKDIVESAARKYDVAVSTVQPHYSSQECNCCHCIDKENRLTQDLFECTKCKVIIDADFNSPKNLVNRVTSKVLRNKLLKEKYIGSGIYEPRTKKKEVILEALSMHRY